MCIMCSSVPRPHSRWPSSVNFMDRIGGIMYIKSSPNWPFPFWSFWSFAQRFSTEKLCLQKRLGGASSLGGMPMAFLGKGESNNKPPIWGWFIPPIFADLGMAYYCFTHITDIRKMMTMTQWSNRSFFLQTHTFEKKISCSCSQGFVKQMN